MALINPLLGSNLASTGFDSTLIGSSVWLDGSADYLNRTPGSAGNRTRWTIAWWFKLNAISTEMVFFSANSGTNEFRIGLEAAGQMMVQDDNASMNMQTAMLFRDVAYYHCIVSYDSNQAEADRVKVFVNGVDQTLNAVGAGTPSSAGETFWNNNQANEIGRRSRTTSVYTNAYMAQILFLDGDSTQNSDVSVNDILGTATFGTNGSQRIPKKGIESLATAAGGNSFLLDFADSSNLGNDISDNTNDFTVNSMGSANQSSNTPSKVYSVFNPNAIRSNAFTLSNGNRTAVTPASDQWIKMTIPFLMSGSNIIRTQFTFDSVGQTGCGITGSSHTAGTYHTAATSVAGKGEVVLFSSSGDLGLVIDGNFTNTYVSGGALSNGDVVDVIVNCDVGAVYFAVNGTLLNSATQSEIQAGTTTNAAITGGSFVRRAAGEVFNFFVVQMNPSSGTITYNSGQSSFAHNYSTITSLVSLNTADLPAPDYQGIDYFDATLYEGNGTAIGSGGKAVTGVGFKPDFVWIKNRDASDSHALYDVVRGTTKQIETDTTAIETTEAEGLSVFGSDGFTVGSLAEVNTSSEDYISWDWLAGGSASSNGSGSITSSVSAAAPGHFSIVGYNGNSTNGATVGHSLGGTPELIIFRGRGGSGASSFIWRVFNTTGGAGKYLRLNDSTALQDDTGYLNNTLPNETVFTLGTDGDVNNSNYNYVAYCFRSVPGVCKIGSYEGNGASDGVYISLGFRPRWFMVKNLDTAGQDWRIYDSTLDAANPNIEFFKANTNAAQISSSGFDFLADGVKARDNNAGFNSAATFVYVAFADIASGAGLAPIYGGK